MAQHRYATPAVSHPALRVEYKAEDLLMHSQNLDTSILDAPVDPQIAPTEGANGAPADGTTEESDLDDLLDYKHVPPRRVVTISVQYRNLGRGQPFPYPVEDDEE
jgi:hypothetical protein